MSDASTPVRYERRGPVGLILVDRPPVNAIDASVRSGVDAALRQALADAEARIVLLACSGRTFMAGADISEFDAAPSGTSFTEVLEGLERSPKPTVAAIHGTALGGGLEMALACHYRVAVPTARMGLPEITLGIIPGAGGTQRLPRVAGALNAFNLILAGAPVDAQEALRLGIVDAVESGEPVEAGLAFAERLLAEGAKPRPTADRSVNAEGFDDEAIAAALKQHARALKGRTTQRFIIEAVKAAVEKPFAEGLAVEARLAAESMSTRESQALRHLFFAERQVTRIPGMPKDVKPAGFRKVAVVGAGTMGSGIATSFALAGHEVVLLDAQAAGLERGHGLVRGNIDANVKRGRMDQASADRALALAQPSLDFSAAADVDLVVEAVFEDMALKTSVLAQLDGIVPPHAVLASNTSTLSVTELGRATRRPGKVVGLHFFSPAHIMRLLEIVRGEDTSFETLATAQAVARTLKKIGVVSADRFGFIGNRMMLDGYWREGELLLLEGASPEQVDRVMEGFGFAMGPHRVSDLGGTDVGTKVRQELFRRETREPPYFVVADALTEMGRLGQKTCAGFYRYDEDGRTAIHDPEVEIVIERLAGEHGVERRASISDAEIEERCILALINVGAMVLEEGTAYRASDIDVVWTAGYGFPRHKGGPMFHADTLGAARVLERIRYWEARRGHYWKPAKLLVELGESGGSFARLDG